MHIDVAGAVLLMLVTAGSLSCGSKADSIAPKDDASVDGSDSDAGASVRGGAHLQLQGGLDPESSGTLNCADSGKEVTIAVTGADGLPKLIVDGVDGAVVSCQVTATKLSVSVSNARGAFSATGTITTDAGKTASKDAKVSLAIPGAAYRSNALPCLIDFTENSAGKLAGVFTCPKLVHETLAGQACAVSAVSNAYIKFDGCKGF